MNSTTHSTPIAPWSPLASKSGTYTLLPQFEHEAQKHKHHFKFTYAITLKKNNTRHLFFLCSCGATAMKSPNHTLYSHLPTTSWRKEDYTKIINP